MHAIADGARVISDFRVMADQGELFGLVASVPTAWRTLKEIAAAGPRRETDHRRGEHSPPARVGASRRGTARCRASGWRTGPSDGVTCIRLDATVTPAHSDKELAEANFKGYGHHPLLAACDGHRRAAGVDAVAPRLSGQQHRCRPIALVNAAIAALPRRG